MTGVDLRVVVDVEFHGDSAAGSDGVVVGELCVLAERADGDVAARGHGCGERAGRSRWRRQ